MNRKFEKTGLPSEARELKLCGLELPEESPEH